MKNNKFMTLKLSIKYGKKTLFIHRKIPEIQIRETIIPTDIIFHNFNDMLRRMAEKIKTENLL